MAHPIYYQQPKKKNFFSCYDFDDEPEYRLKMKSPKPQKVQYAYQVPQQPQYISQPPQAFIQQNHPQLTSSIAYAQAPIQQPVQAAIPSYSYRQQPQQVVQYQQGYQTMQPGQQLGHSIVGNVQQPLGNSLVGQPQMQAAPFQR